VVSAAAPMAPVPEPGTLLLAVAAAITATGIVCKQGIRRTQETIEIPQ
jgi:hypothetical protein